ncbi:hypothetical protein P775_28635 [Puniceibacterium antarcticum]|uniref:Uncharacterized protein n=1 Tax=Puniceibacterium antarcticum TaxID=1206336 RepID=A0A2G8QS53_9RHOB|nr:hypothetical protein P775_28635 [Puniceibacterium antarcticum]
MGYNNYNSDGGQNFDGGTAQFDTTLAFGQFSFDLDVRFDSVKQNGVSQTNLSTDLMPKYWFAPSFGVGIYFARDSVDLDPGQCGNQQHSQDRPERVQRNIVQRRVLSSAFSLSPERADFDRRVSRLRCRP